MRCMGTLEGSYGLVTRFLVLLAIDDPQSMGEIRHLEQQGYNVVVFDGTAFELADKWHKRV